MSSPGKEETRTVLLTLGRVTITWWESPPRRGSLPRLLRFLPHSVFLPHFVSLLQQLDVFPQRGERHRIPAAVNGDAGPLHDPGGIGRPHDGGQVGELHANGERDHIGETQDTTVRNSTMISVPSILPTVTGTRFSYYCTRLSYFGYYSLETQT